MNSSDRKLGSGSVIILRQAQDTLRTFPKAVITAQDRLRRKGRAVLRVVLATAFFWLTTLFSIGIQLTASVTQAKDGMSKKKSRSQIKYRKASYDTKNTSIVGVASWYGTKFHGRKTASGVKYNQNAMMAAHKTLPFGTILRVTNLDNGRTCYVEITDRGPYIKGREIDLSRAAAVQLGFKDNGTARVQLNVINNDVAELYRDLFINNPKGAVIQDALSLKNRPSSAAVAE